MQYQFSKEKGFTIVSLPSSSVHDARVLDRPPTPTPAEFILGGITTVILIWAILVGSQWAYEVLSELSKRAVYTLKRSVHNLKRTFGNLKPGQYFMLSSPSDLPHALATNDHLSYDITPIAPSQVSTCLGRHGTRPTHLRSFDEISEMGQIYRLARLVLNREVYGLVGWELVGGNQWMEGGFVGGSSTIVVKVRGDAWRGVVYKRVLSGFM